MLRGVTEIVRSRHFGRVAVVELHRPEVRHAMNTELLRSLIGALQERHPEGAGNWADGGTWIVAMDYDTGQRVLFGRPGAPPANAMRGAAPSVLSLTDGKSRFSLRSASSRLFGTTWACVSMIMGGPSVIASGRNLAPVRRDCFVAALLAMTRLD